MTEAKELAPSDRGRVAQYAACSPWTVTSVYRGAGSFSAYERVLAAAQLLELPEPPRRDASPREHEKRIARVAGVTTATLRRACAGKGTPWSRTRVRFAIKQLGLPMPEPLKQPEVPPQEVVEP